MEQIEGTHQQCLYAILIKCMVVHGITLKPCNAISGYNPTLQILQCSANYTDVFGASFAFIAHCSEQFMIPETPQY